MWNFHVQVESNLVWWNYVSRQHNVPGICQDIGLMQAGVEDFCSKTR